MPEKMSKNEIIGIIATVVILAIILSIAVFVITKNVNIKESISKNLKETKHFGLIKRDELYKSATKGVSNAKSQIVNALDGKKEEVKVEIFFELANSSVTDAHKKDLDALIKVYKKMSNPKVQILGYADAQGDKYNNIKLSVERTKSVKKYLEDNGVTSIDNVGFGAESTKERKVVIKVVN